MTLLVATVAVLVTGCRGDPAIRATATPTDDGGGPTAPTEGRTEPAPGSATPAAGGSSACQVTETGGSSDLAFNASAYRGLRVAERDLGLEVTALEPGEDGHGTAISTLLEQRCDVIVTVGDAAGEATRSAAEANPDQPFVAVDVRYDPPIDNVLALTFATDEPAFLADYLAAGMSDSGVVATLGGADIPAVTTFMDGFAAGVGHWNRTQGAQVELLGWDLADPTAASFVGALDDEEGARALTDQLLERGADIVMPVTGAGIVGAAEAVREWGHAAKLIWVDSDGCTTAEEYCDLILTSVLQHADIAVAAAIADAVGGAFDGGTYVGTLENDGVGLAPFHELAGEVPEELAAAIEELSASITDGTIAVEPSPDGS